MDIVTDRLILHGLSPAEAGRIVERAPETGDLWHAEYPLEDELDPLRSLAASSGRNPAFTLFAIRTAADGIAVGGIGFFGPPNEDGSVELGYGVVEAVRGRGFATEALNAATRHALSNGARRISADTGLENLASQRVLAKANFREVSRSEESVFYTFP